MEKKSLLSIILIILLLLVIGYFIYGEIGEKNRTNEIQIADVNFALPTGYSATGLNNLGDLIISDGKDKIYMTIYDTNHVEDYMGDYNNNRKQANETVSFSNLTINNVHVYKATTNTGATRFWFVKNDQTYIIYTLTKNKNIDDIISKLIKSMSTNN